MEEMRQLADANREWKKLESRILQTRHPSSILINCLKYAAIIVVVVTLPFTVIKMKLFNSPAASTGAYATVVTGKGGRSQLTFPDSTRVWLNSCTSLTYYTGSESDRRVTLLGEAYFEVAKDEHHPFIVSTPLMDVKVLGTKFNLRAFDDENQVQATLYEGQILAHIADPAFRQEVLLKPGEQLTYGKNKIPAVTTGQVQNDRDWKDGIFYFRQQTLQTIARTLERSFNVEITITDEQLSQEKFTCEFKNGESLNDILRILKMTKKLNYSITGSKIKIVPENK
jgi:ferric-dicitrate binding protein FerR (iron transport regulator)